MPASCVIPDCNLKYTHSEDVSFHKFPLKAPDLLKQWLQFAGRDENWRPTQWSAVCSRHFVPNDFRDCQFRKKLLPCAVPSVRTVVSNISSSDLSMPLAYETVWSDADRPFPRNDEFVSDELDALSIGNVALCPVAVSDSVEELGIEGEECSLIEITCRICGVVFNPATDGLLAELAQSVDEVRKYLPFVNLDIPNLPRKICLNCSKVVNGFSKFSDSVLHAQSDLEHRFALQQVDACIVNTSKKHDKPVKIKQEPNTSIIIKEEKTEYAINSSARQKDHLPSEPIEGAMILKNQTFVGDTNRIFLFNNPNQDHSSGPTTTTSLIKQHNVRESAKNCEILEIVNLYPPIVDITSTTVTEVQPYEITLPSVTTATASDPLSTLPSSFACTTPQFMGNLKVENMNELDAEQDEYYLPDKFAFLNTLEEHSYTKLPIQADDNKDEIFNDMAVGNGCGLRFETTGFTPQAQRKEPAPQMSVPRWTCTSCEKSFASLRSLLCHRALKCTRQRKLSVRCTFCHRKFPSWSRARSHICICPKRTRKRKRLEQRLAMERARCHQLTKMQLECCLSNREQVVITKYPCQMCDRTYSNASNLRRHLTTHRPPDQWNHKCGVCHKIFDKLFDLKKHLQLSTCANGGNPERVCSPQPRESLDEKNLLRESLPETGERLLYVCSTCNKIFQTYNSLKVHEPIHTGTKAFICETCGKRFSGRSNLWQHRLTHSELRQFRCKQCPKVFKRSGGLGQHVRAIHMKIKPYRCDTCGHEYALKADMTRCRHSRLHDSMAAFV